MSDATERADVQACEHCGLHPYDFDVHEYKQELDRVDAIRRDLDARLRAAEERERRVRYILENIADPYNERIGNLKRWADDALAVLSAASTEGADG